MFIVRLDVRTDRVTRAKAVIERLLGAAAIEDCQTRQ
jgi:hypothetical protein